MKGYWALWVGWAVDQTVCGFALQAVKSLVVRCLEDGCVSIGVIS